MIIKPLVKKFNSRGSIYEQVRREGDLAIYSLRYTSSSPIIGFDVVRVCQTTLEVYNGIFRDPLRRIQGNPDDVVESYPSSSQWGYKAWSYTTLPYAEKKFMELKESEQKEGENE